MRVKEGGDAGSKGGCGRGQGGGGGDQGVLVLLAPASHSEVVAVQVVPLQCMQTGGDSGGCQGVLV